MWPGQQPPGGEQNPQDQNPYQQPGYQQPNPYQQPGYQQPNPYQQQPAQYGGPVPPGGPQPPEGKGKKTTVVAIVAATAVVAAAVITGVVVMGKDDEGGKKTTQASDDKDKKKTSPSPETGEAGKSDDPAAPSSPPANPRGGSTQEAKPSIPGWKPVTNPKYGTTFDVPPDWEVEKPGVTVGFEDSKDAMGKPLISMSAPAYYKSKWCTEDSDKDGDSEDNRLAGVGTRGANGASDGGVEAQNVAGWWVFSAYDQKKTGKVQVQKAKPFTTTSGLKGSYSTATVTGVAKKTKCASDGKSIAFAFKNAAGDFAVWNLYTAKGVPDELPDATIQKILATVRLPG